MHFCQSDHDNEMTRRQANKEHAHNSQEGGLALFDNMCR